MAAGISALAIPLNELLTSNSCPIDDFLFGKSFPDQLKSSKETQRLGYTIKKQQKVAHFMSPKTDITKKTIPVSQEKGGGEISLQGSIGSPIGTLPEDPAQTIVSPVKTSYAGRLATYSHTWAKIANDRHVLSWISGYKLLFSNRPVQSYIPKPSFTSNDLSKVNDAITNLLQIGAVHKQPQMLPGLSGSNKFYKVYTFLGFVYDSISFKVSLPVEKQTLILFVAACPTVKYGWVHRKTLKRKKYLASRSSNQNYESLLLSELIKSELHWWYNALSQNKAFNAPRSFASDFSDCSILLRIDNVTAIACINRRGSVRIKSLNNITRRICLWCENKNIFLVASYINTKSNSSFFPFQHLSSEVAKPFPGGWNFIREAFHRRRVPTVGLQSIQSSLSPSTLKQYTAYLKKWWDFCATRQHSPFQYSLNLILTFLSIQFQNGASYATINSQHAAIVLIFPVKNSDKIIFKRSLKGIYNQKPSMPKYQATWDPHPVLLHLARLYPLEKISRLQLTMKLVTLLALITGHRLQTLTSIRLQNIVRFPDRLEIRISDRIKTSSSKSLQPFLVIPYFKDNPALCLASVVDYYELVINYELITKDLRPSDIDYLILTVKRPIRQVSSQRLSNWIEQTLAASGIDTTDFTIDPGQTILHFLLKES
nr:unnamed protein product [Callosobruchus chinensis]